MVIKFRRHPSDVGNENGHAVICVFVGPDADHLAKAGDVIVRDDEWQYMQDSNKLDVIVQLEAFDSDGLSLNRVRSANQRGSSFAVGSDS